MTDFDTNPDLEALFATARSRPPEPSAALMARVQADALAAQPVPHPRVLPKRGWLPAWVQTLGGWPAAAGLSAAAVAGLAIGFVPPEAVSDALTTLFYGDELWLDPLGGFDLAAMEG